MTASESKTCYEWKKENKRMKIKKILAITATMVLLLPTLAACQNNEGAGDTIKIGGLAPLTGNVSVYGITATNGVKLAIKEINEAGGVLGKQIEYIVEDEKGDVNEAVNAYNKLVNKDKVIAIIGDVTSKPTISVAQLAAKETDPVPMVTATATALDVTKQGTNVFRACFTDPFQGKTMADFAAGSLGLTKVAVIYNSSDDYSVGLTEAFQAEAEAKGIEVVAVESYSKGDIDFKTQLGNIATAGPEALFVPDYYDNVAMIVNQAQEVGLDIPLLGADGWDGVVGAIDDADKLEGFYFCNHYSTEDESETVQNFLTNYKAAYNEDATSFAALGYDAAYIMMDAIEKAGSTDRAAIIAALAETNLEGVTGSIAFDADRNPVKSVTIIQIKEGKYTLYDKLDA